MARINVEDSILTDQRFLNLAIKLGSAQFALGVVVWAWRQAQRHYLSTEHGRCIPFDEWKKQGCDDRVIEVGLAEKREHGVWLVGSDEQFGWLLQKQKAGEKSVKARKARKKKGNEHTLTDVDERSTTLNGSEPLSSFLSSLSSNLNLSLPNSVLNQLVERVFREVFPRKIGLKTGRELLLREIKTAGDITDLYFAAVKYMDYVKDPENKVEKVYGFGGFAQVWRDWIPQNNFQEGA